MNTRLITTIFIIILSSLTMINADYKKPDFAYPKQVAKDSEKLLKNALKNGDDAVALRAVIDLTLAESAVSNENLKENLVLIENIKSDKKASKFLKSMLALIQADIYSSVYSENRWNYDRRELPLEPLPKDYSEWSGEQFRNVITQLIDETMSYKEALNAAKIDNYSLIVNIEKGSEVVYPTMLDFAAYRSLTLLENISSSTSIDGSWILRGDDFLASEFISSDKVTTAIHDIYAALVSLKPSNSLPYMMAEINRLKWSHNKFVKAENQIGKQILDIYAEYQDYDFSALAILEGSEYCDNNYHEYDDVIIGESAGENFLQAYYDATLEYGEKFPNSMYAEKINSLNKHLRRKSVNITGPQSVAPGIEFEVEAEYKDASKFYVYLCEIQGSKNEYIVKSIVEKKEITDSREHLFHGTAKIKFKVPKFGLYAVLTAYSDSIHEGKKLKDLSEHSIIHASRIYPFALAFKSWKNVYAADAVTGRPINGVSVTDTETGKCLGMTDGEGFLKVITGDEYSLIKGDDKYAEFFRVYNPYYYDIHRLEASVTTSLPLYHPGDEMQWAAVIRSVDDGKSEICSNYDVTVIIRDANYQEVEKKSYKTDEFGRITGKITLPTSGLMGEFRIEVRDNNRIIGTKYVTVSDYKLPTFSAKITDVSIKDGSAVIKGCATDYSGFPISDAKVFVSAEYSTGMLWFYSFTPLTTYETVTDAAGAFEIVIDSETLKKHGITDSAIQVSCNVTSAAGETQACEYRFAIGKPYRIELTTTSFDIRKPAALRVSVSDPMGNIVEIPLNIRLLNAKNDSIVAVKAVAKPTDKVDFSDIAPGEYKISVEPSDSTLANPTLPNNVILYNPDKRELEIRDVIWTPNSDIVTKNRSHELLLATCCDTICARMFVMTADSIASEQWITLTKGLNKVAVLLPDSVEEAFIHIAGVKDYKPINEDIRVVIKDEKQKYSLSIESFRDNIVPGGLETIKLKTTYPVGTGIKSALMLNIFSKSIDDIEHHSPLAFSYIGKQKKYRLAVQGIGNVMVRNAENSYFSFYLPYPELNLWEYEWMFERSMYHSAPRYSMMCKASNNFVGDYCMDDCEVAPAPMADMAAEIETEESAVDSGTEKPKQQEEYRPSEEPLALFEPLLTTDEDGNVAVSFTYPRIATTWIMNAVAYTADMLTDTQARNIVASRPLMVKCALPRFIRQGDKVVLAATVMNNTDEAKDSIGVTIDIIDTGTGNAIANLSDTISLGAMESKVMTLPIKAQNAGTPLLFRIKASDGSNSDGEQSLIAALESAQPVIETRPFYMGIDQTTVNVPIPRGSNAKVTLEFYENPTWSVVTAIPSLREEEPLTSPSAAGAIFSAAVAEGIMKQNPEIAGAIRYWMQSDKSDSTLVSMLSKNQDLKVALLECTPWMQDAMNDTQRMTRLALLLDKKEIDRVYETSINVLARLQRHGGGWAWSSYGTESSEWATQNVLAAFAMLRQLGYYPSIEKLDEMVKNAVLFLDAKIAEHNKRAKQTLPDMLYTYTRTFYGDVKQSTASKKTSDKTVQDIISDWKKYDLHEKALSVIILNRSNYPSMARIILKSISEFSTSTEEKGMWWDNLGSRCWWASSLVSTNALILNAYAEVDPSSEDIDLIRQWLLLEKSRNDWGDAVATSHAVTAILSTGTKWTVPATTRCAVRINSSLVEPEKIDKITGHFRKDVSDLVNGPSTLTIDKVANIPAYGALYSITTQRMEDVKSNRCDELSIEKRFLVKRLTSDGETWEETTEFKVGDVVKISLTLKAKETMNYVAIVDNRPACLEPVNQLPTPVFSDGLYFYRETRNDRSSLFIDYLRKGTFILEQEFTVTHSGTFASGLATAQSQYAPQFAAHSAGCVVTVE